MTMNNRRDVNAQQTVAGTHLLEVLIVVTTVVDAPVSDEELELHTYTASHAFDLRTAMVLPYSGWHS